MPHAPIFPLFSTSDIYIYIYIHMYMVLGFFEVATEKWPEWDLNPRPLNSVQTL